MSIDLGMPLNLLIMYAVILLTGIFFLKRTYCDNESIYTPTGVFYIILFAIYISQVLIQIRDNPLNLPFIAVLSSPVLAVFAVFSANFFTQVITIGEFFKGNVRFHFIDHLSQALKSLQSQDYKKAIDSYRRFLELNPDDFQIHMEIAEIYALYIFDYPSAIKEYEIALRKSWQSQHSIAITNRLADLYFSKMNRPDIASVLLLSIIKYWPGTEAAQRASERILGMKDFISLKKAG